MQLRELQHAFQARIVGYRHGIETALQPAQSADLEVRLATYVEGYRSRLVEALGSTYPVLKLALGDGEFERLMHEYIESSPSRHYSIRYYGERLADRLSTLTATDERGPGLAELARWEWQLADVFDAPDDEALTVDALADVPPEAWATVSFSPRACVRRLATRTNAAEWWRFANGLCDSPSKLKETTPVQWLFWRRGERTLFRSLDIVEADALDAAFNGATFGVLCEQIALRVPVNEAAPRAAGLLRGWISEEIVARYTMHGTPT